jgi:hypothetical protein
VTALRKLRSAEKVADTRGKPVDEVLAGYPVAASSVKAATAASIVGSSQGGGSR